MAVSIGATTLYTSFGSNATANILAAPGRLYGIVAVNRNAAARYIQLYDTTSATTPIWMQFVIPAGDQIAIALRLYGFIDGAQFATGLTYGFSTTAGSYVAATAGESDIMAWYRKIGR